MVFYKIKVNILIFGFLIIASSLVPELSLESNIDESKLYAAILVSLTNCVAWFSSLSLN